ncbi:MAG: cyclodeaminase/cyclohydrolase family protein, partial [Actinomycetaceae bacterium]|nr:cyclodeaminase/cyclohydrolase family protein [Actinomycetaceae bacterium]
GFRTLPYDDTGVPHIIEHSVLCGSEKYPVKDPFVQLAKGSFATFLNAFTSPDCTCYPVCSRNQQELLNLMDVYMDAVLHPLSVQSPLAFKQEGWHYELDGPDGELKRNGIVYSEMKGGFSNPERLLYTEVSRLLFPDTTYGFVSGGDPASIPTLTFEMYKSFYNRFYHPSNARIFLDGNMDVKAVLAKLDGFLSPYERKVVDAPVKFQRPVSAEKTMEYEIGADEKTEGKVYVATGWVCGRFDEREKSRALEVLVSVIAGENSSPLKKALVDTGLCEDLYWGCSKMAQIRSGLTVKGVKAENVDAVRRTIRETLSRLAAEGLDHARMLCRAMVETGNPNSVTDAGVGALAARAAVIGAGMNVKINASSLTDRAVAEKLIAEANELVAQANAEEAEITAMVEEKIK